MGYGFSTHGREFVLSLLGWHYLNKQPGKPGPDETFDLGDGKQGRVTRVGPLHTTFDTGAGQQEMRPNAWLMTKRFKWAAPSQGAAGQ